MAFEFEALVGHLYIVGGRSLTMLPPGALVEVAPKKAARGREADTFFVLVLPSGETHASVQFYEQMAASSADRYFSSSGSVTAGLRSVFTSLNEDLNEHNHTSPKQYEAAMICAVMRGDELIVGRVGAGSALFYNGAEIETFPPDLSDDDALFTPPLGVQPLPAFKMKSFDLRAGARLLLSDASLADLNREQLEEVIRARAIDAVLSGYETLATRATLMAVEFVPPEVPAVIGVPTGDSTAAVAAVDAAAAGIDLDKVPTSGARYMIDGAGITLRKSVGRIALILSKIAGLLGKMLDRLLPDAEENQKSLLSSPLATGTVVFVPIAVVVAVLILWLAGTGQSEFELCVQETTQTASIARNIAFDDVEGTLAAWNAVIGEVERCERIRPQGDPILTAMRSEGQAIIDRLFSIDRREARPLAAFNNAALKRIVIQGLDLFVLDDRNDLVYRTTLATDGLSVVANSQQAFRNMRRGAAVGGNIIQDIIDITWADNGGGTTRENVLVAVDRNGVVVDCSPRVQDSCGAQVLLGSENWAEPVAATFWQGRLYILDPGRDQIWRYEPSGSSYPNPPTEYFAGQDRPSIRGAVDFSIDDNGSIYVLYEDGSMRKFRSGEEQPFGFAAFPDGLELNHANSFYLNNSPFALGLLIINPENRTIFDTSLAGTFNTSYRTFDEDQFALISSVAADADKRVIYATSGNTILAFERAPQN
ncbi:MAG: hypothetical protein D6737_15570 [Chloroflexi bacterium]|nr:MAG: hypothetical protein D6737_15570 [Chloroflexota bacterium]